jgi:hypothetical protein
MAQVDSPPPGAHSVWPAWQLSVHDVEQDAFGAMPEHVCGEAQSDCEST